MEGVEFLDKGKNAVKRGLSFVGNTRQSDRNRTSG